MAITLTLQRFDHGDTGYIAKHNSNADVLEGAVRALESQLGGAFGASVSIGDALAALLGSTTTLIGSGSYVPSGSGNTLTVSPGFAWRPDLGLVLRSSGTVKLSFAGVSAGTYYLVPDSNGAPTRSNSSTGALYSISWSGSAFGVLTRLAPVVWGASDQTAAQTSTALGSSYLKLDDRLEAAETKAVAGAAAQTWKTARLVKSVAGGVDVTLSSAEANAFALEFTGVLTGHVSVAIPVSDSPRGWVVRNATSGPYTLTIKSTAGGSSGVRLAQGARLWLMHDGIHLYAVGASPAQPATVVLPYTAQITADFSYADSIRITLAGSPTITLSGAGNGQKCILELTQDASGGHSVTFGPEVRLGSDLTLLSLSSEPGKTDRIGFIYDQASATYDAVAIMRGF